MARKIIDVWPVLSVTPEQGRCWTKDEALAAYREVNEALKHLQTPSRFRLNIGFNFQEDARCEHCNGAWTEEGDAFNGGCCAKDSANDPERLAQLLVWAGELRAADLNRSDDTNGMGGHYEFTDLGEKVERWLAAGRPVADARDLELLAEAVDGREWGQLWTDPGDYPSNAGSGPLPDHWTVDDRPNEMARQVFDLLDDMGLIPRTAPVALSLIDQALGGVG